MKTDDLIDGLTARLSPVDRNALLRTLSLMLLAGFAVSFFLMLFWLGIRPDIAQAVQGMSFWMKFAYTLALAVAGFSLTERLARPVGEAKAGFTIALVAIAAILVAAIAQLAAQPEGMRQMIIGATWQVCARNIVLVSLPLFVAIFLAMRRFAPTRIFAAGAAAGLLAGAAGALVYGFHCDESAAPFVAIWYTLGMGIVAGLGALIAKAGALRW